MVGCEIEKAQEQESRPADLRRRQRDKALVRQHHKADGGGKPQYRDSDDGGAEHCEKLAGEHGGHGCCGGQHFDTLVRSEELRVGKECVSKGGYRGAPYHYKTKYNSSEYI